MSDVEASPKREPSPFGKLVKRYRLARNMSQERLEALMGKRPGSGYVSQLETGARGHRVSRDTALAAAQALDANTREFLEAAGKLEPGDTLSPEVRPDFRTFVRTEPTLRLDQKDVLLRLYDGWVGKGG